ncbi:MAG: type II toxin-antitoxin system VapC family toxin [Methylococcales bacterium]|nr:type II toxin-antitoxin system VapC family toxin [Methylococcales bacterium]
MKYLFDSNTISDLYNAPSQPYQNICKRLSQLADADEVAISIVTLYELEYAFHNAPDNKQAIIRNDINHLKSNFSIMPLSIPSAEIFGQLKKQFKDSSMINKENIKKHNIDMMLASTAICENSILVSADKIYIHLQQLNNNLHTEDWTL